MAKDKEFLSKVLQLLCVTDNLKLNDCSVKSMLDPLYSSVSGSKLISALLLERKFVLNLIKALLAPGVPTLSMLMQGRQMDVKKQPSRSPSAINDNPDRGILA